MATYAEMRELDVWYSRVVADDLLEIVRAAILKTKVKVPGGAGQDPGGLTKRAAATACRRPPR